MQSAWKWKPPWASQPCLIYEWMDHIHVLSLSPRRRCIFSLGRAWQHGVQLPERGRWRAWTWTGPAGRACRPVHACIAYGSADGIGIWGGSRGHACIHGRGAGEALARAQTRFVLVWSRWAMEKIKLKPPQCKDVVRVCASWCFCTSMRWIYGSTASSYVLQ